MIVANLQALLQATRQFAEAADVSGAAKEKLAAVCESLEPFRAMDVSAFAELLRQADEYRTTGVLPILSKPVKVSSKTAKATPEDSARKVEQLAKQLNDLSAVVHQESVGFGAIDEICAVIGKLTAPEVKQIAEQFGIKLSSKTTKPKALEEIKRKLTEQKGSAQRIQPIQNS